MSEPASKGPVNESGKQGSPGDLDRHALDAVSVRLRAEGDGRKRIAEVVAEAIGKIAHYPPLRQAWQRHPNLRTVAPETLLAKVSRKRAGRVLESGLLFADDDGTEIDGDAIFGRGRELDENVPLAMLLTALDFLPPAPAKGAAPLPVLYEDAHWVAFDKPSGLPTAPIRSDETDTAVQRALVSHPELPVLRGNPLEPGLVHRLDTGTSGVLLFAKSSEAFARLEAVWNGGQVRKIYRAETSHGPARKGRLDLRLGHDAKSKRKMRAIDSPADLKKIRGEPSRAISEILSIDRISAAGEADRFEVTIRIETGVHHQIRATLAHLGAPILGDSVYGGAPDSRLWLHAWKLILPDGFGADAGRPLEIVAPVPRRES